MADRDPALMALSCLQLRSRRRATSRWRHLEQRVAIDGECARVTPFLSPLRDTALALTHCAKAGCGQRAGDRRRGRMAVARLELANRAATMRWRRRLVLIALAVAGSPSPAMARHDRKSVTALIDEQDGDGAGARRI